MGRNIEAGEQGFSVDANPAGLAKPWCQAWVKSVKGDGILIGQSWGSQQDTRDGVKSERKLGQQHKDWKNCQ